MDGITRVQRFGKALLIALLCLATGAAIARLPSTYILALIGFGLIVVVARWNRGAFVGIVVLLLLDGVPFVNTEIVRASTGAGSNALNDVIFIALAVFLVVCAFRGIRNKEQAHLARLAVVWGACYLAWWLFKVMAGSPGIPVTAAAKYGQEFMGFSLLLPLGLLAIRRRSDLEGFGFVLAVGASVFAFGQILTQVGSVHITGLIHIAKAAEFEGVTRIYAPMNEALMAAFPIALAAAVLGPRRYRGWAIALTLLTGLGEALSFVRAEYIGEILALIIISLIWVRGSNQNTRRIRRASCALVVVAVVAVVAITGSNNAGGTSTSNSPFQAVASRVVLGVTNLQNESGTTAIRLHEAHRELQTLGGHWLAGLGFLDPSYHYVSGLREGSIRNDDLGSLSIVMTMGLIGLLLAYMPPIAGLIYLLRRRRGFVEYGAAIYLAAALISSITLGAVATRSGLLVLGSMLILCLGWTTIETSTTTGSDLRKGSD